MRSRILGISLERQQRPSPIMSVLSPVLATLLMIIAGGVMFAARGINPIHGLYIYFIEPVTTVWSIEELVVKATPLILIACGLSVCFRANVWNIGAEGQLTLGAIAGSAIPILLPQWDSILVIPAMMMMGILGGALWSAIPALLRTRFRANEILTSLMLVYVAQLLLDWLVRGPWRDPGGYNFPESVALKEWQLLPTLGQSRMHLGTIFALLAALALFAFLARSLKGFEIKVTGAAPRASTFSGFTQRKTVWFCLILSGALSGLAGIAEIAGPVGQLQPSISPGYGFTAIIVAFLGRLNPIGVVFASVVLSISYLGGEGAQIILGLSDKTAQVLQGTLLFFILASDTLTRYRVRFRRDIQTLKEDTH